MSQIVRPLRERSGTLRLRLPLAAVQSQSTDYPCPTAVRGLHWTMAVYRTTDDHLAVFVRCVELASMPDLSVKTAVDIRLIGNSTQLVKSFDEPFTSASKTGRGFSKFVAWDRLIDAANGLVVDGALTIEVDIRPHEPRGFDRSSWHPLQFKPFDVDDVLAPDLHLHFYGAEIACSKSVVWRHSKTIREAMTNGKNAGGSVYVITFVGATVEAVRQFVTAMYNEWDEGEMDRHVVPMYNLAHRYKSYRVIHLAMIALKRLLTDATFWATLAAAVLPVVHEEVVKFCARYAVATPDRLGALMARDDGQWEKVRAVLLSAIAALEHVKGEERDVKGAGGDDGAGRDEKREERDMKGEGGDHKGAGGDTTVKREKRKRKHEKGEGRDKSQSKKAKKVTIEVKQESE